MTTTMTNLVPIKGPEYDKTKPETRQPWLDFRRPGITATQVRDWGTASKRRQIIDEKVSGIFEDLSHLPYVDHGNRREPIISDWVQGKWGITPTGATYAHPENSRHLASPDGVTIDPFTGELVVGEDAVVLEIKTSKHDLTPGTLTDDRMLVEIAKGSHFERSNYYTQMQWQMYVMNAAMTLFVYEQHDDKVDPETGTFTPIGVPQYVWVPRNDVLIDVLVNKVVPKALAEIDAALTALRVNELPPASGIPAEDMVTVQALFAARQAEAVAKKAKENAWVTLQERYLGGEDVTHDLGIGTLTVSTSTPTAKTETVEVTDWDAMRKRAPKLVAQYEALLARHTKPEVRIIPAGEPVQRLTVTEKKAKS